MHARQPNGTSTHDRLDTSRWPARRVIWSCQAERGPLLTRYYLLDTEAFAIYVHHLHASDEDRALHDHPWSFVTFLLSSGYWEWTSPDQHPNQRRSALTRYTPVRTWRRRFSVLFRPAEWRHRLELVRPTWTLVLRFRRRRDWGFWTRTGWRQWQAYGREWCD